MTLGALVRRERVLISCLAGAAAVVALAGPLHAHWLYVVGAAVVATGALGRLSIQVRRARLEGARETADLARRTRVPITTVTQVDPTEIGVDAAAQTILDGQQIPIYQPREVDEALRLAVRSAMANSGRWIVVAVGRSKVGKSRTLFEAVRHCAEEAPIDLVAPVDGEALRSLTTPGETGRQRSDRCVLWLDDLEPFLNQGVTFQMLREWHASAPASVVAATYGGKGSDLVAGTGSGSLATTAGEVLQHACEIRVPPTTSGELDSMPQQLPIAVLKSIDQHGLAAYLVAAPELERKLSTEVHAIGEPRCPEGVAVVYAAIDWARCGRTDPIPDATLRDLWPTYLAPGTRATDAGFDVGLEWALRPVAGTIALIQHVASYLAFDYIVRFVDDLPSTPTPLDVAWASALDDGSDAQALTVGVSAHQQAHLDYALVAFKTASKSSTNELAAIGTFNLAVTLGELGRQDEELVVYSDLLERFGDAPELVLREQVARTLVNKGIALGSLGRQDEELVVYSDLLERFGDAPELVLREAVARTLVSKGVTLGSLGRSDEALAVIDGVLERFGQASERELHNAVSAALRARAELTAD